MEGGSPKSKFKLVARRSKVFAKIVVVDLQAEVRIDAICEFAHLFRGHDLRANRFWPAQDDIDSSFLLSGLDALLVDGLGVQIGREQSFDGDAARLQNFNHLDQRLGLRKLILVHNVRMQVLDTKLSHFIRNLQVGTSILVFKCSDLHTADTLHRCLVFTEMVDRIHWSRHVAGLLAGDDAREELK